MYIHQLSIVDNKNTKLFVLKEIITPDKKNEDSVTETALTL